ncbi:hypothetical protein CPAR01_04148 [Colletotrichum paranaense]|nr:uncharacterized protein CPAR01_04148 [Colletotrichum paranaense]KAK1543515.1 hypothetical protein CPAR01_04148 [Colletotrichum paranaense]
MPIPLSAREACWRVTGCSSAAHGTTFPPSRTGTSPCARARGHVMHYQSLKRPQKIPRQIANPMFCLAYGYYVILGGLEGNCLSRTICSTWADLSSISSFLQFHPVLARRLSKTHQPQTIRRLRSYAAFPAVREASAPHQPLSSYTRLDRKPNEICKRSIQASYITGSPAVWERGTIPKHAHTARRTPH